LIFFLAAAVSLFSPYKEPGPSQARQKEAKTKFRITQSEPENFQQVLTPGGHAQCACLLSLQMGSIN
jgi:hypothetical protein